MGKTLIDNQKVNETSILKFYYSKDDEKIFIPIEVRNRYVLSGNSLSYAMRSDLMSRRAVLYNLTDDKYDEFILLVPDEYVSFSQELGDVSQFLQVEN